FPLVLRERMTADGNTSQPTGPGDGIFLLAYEGRVIAGQRECGDYFVVDQQVGREQGLTLMHLVRTYAWAEGATEAAGSFLRALGETNGSRTLDAKVVARLGADLHRRVAIHGSEADVEATIGCTRGRCTLELFVSR